MGFNVDVFLGVLFALMACAIYIHARNNPLYSTLDVTVGGFLLIFVILGLLWFMGVIAVTTPSPQPANGSRTFATLNLDLKLSILPADLAR